jgi:hypothetical protein
MRLELVRRLWWLLALLLLSGCESGLYSGSLIFSGEHLFETGAHLPGDVYMRAGNARFEAGSRIDGTVTMLGGSMTFNGEIGGDLLLLDGTVMLGPEAVVGGDLRQGGGTLEAAESAVVGGQVITGSTLQLPLDTLEQERGWDDWLRLLSAALLLAGLGALLVRSRPEPVLNVGAAAIDHALVAGALGLLILLVLPALLVMMAFTVILIPLVVVLGLLLILVYGYGLVAIGRQVGIWLSQFVEARWGRTLSPPAATFWGTLVLAVAFEIPYLGDGLLAVTMILVSGALLLTRLGVRRYSPPLLDEASPDLASYRRRSER